MREWNSGTVHTLIDLVLFTRSFSSFTLIHDAQNGITYLILHYWLINKIFHSHISRLFYDAI